MELAAAALALGLGQLVKAVTGFGSALVAMPVLLVVYGPAQALLLMACADLVAGTLLVWDVRRRVRWALVGALLAGALPGQWIGTELLVVLDPLVVARLLGVITAGMGASLVWRPVVAGRGERTDLPERPGPLLAQGAVAGLLGGLLGGVVGAGGPPLIAWCNHHFEARFMRAQLIVTFHVASVVLVGLLLWRGAEVSVLAALPWALVPLWLGNRAGTALSARVSRAGFARLTGVVLLLAGVGLLTR